MSATGESATLPVAALVAYDGSDYFGFQVQSGVPTIQGALEEALSTFTTLQGRVTGAGRTDTGVHARGQVVGATVVWKHTLADLQRAWNAHLPSAISVRSLAQGTQGWHPRFSALSRTYRYTVVEWGGGRTAPLHAPLAERFAHFERSALDSVAMAAAAQTLVGRRDFAAFGQPPQGENSVRTVSRAEWDVVPQPATLEAKQDRTLLFTITADAFLQHMVRRIVGSLLEVGRGRWSVERFADVLASCELRNSAPPAVPNGLVLEAVEYPSQWGINFWNSNDQGSLR